MASLTGVGRSMFNPVDADFEARAQDENAKETARLEGLMRDGDVARQLLAHPGWKLLMRIMDARFNKLTDAMQTLDAAKPGFASEYGILQARLKELRELADTIPECKSGGEAAQETLKQRAEESQQDSERWQR